MFAAPLRVHDMSQVAGVHPALRAGDVLVADRGFCSYVHLALLLQRGVQAVIRMHQKQIVDATFTFCFLRSSVYPFKQG